jgi:NAD(P)-dependent dehydrogenase (short-subunit alcohol dehydrogenase family)
MSESSPKTALVTGASPGLGRNTAIALARKGIDVIGPYHSNKAEAAATVSAIEALGRKAVMFQLDADKASTFAPFAPDLKQALATTWGRKTFDYLVNNAGTGISAPLAETTETDFDQLMDIHLKGVFFLTQTLLPLIADGGRVVNISSGLARFSLPGYATYAMMKGGRRVLTRYLAKELGPRGIAANTVAPGAIETDIAGGSVRDDKQVNDFIASVTALERAGVPDDSVRLSPRCSPKIIAGSTPSASKSPAAWSSEPGSVCNASMSTVTSVVTMTFVSHRSTRVPAVSRDRSKPCPGLDPGSFQTPSLKQSPLSRGRVWNAPGSAAHLRAAREEHQGVCARLRRAMPSTPLRHRLAPILRDARKKERAPQDEG